MSIPPQSPDRRSSGQSSQNRPVPVPTDGAGTSGGAEGSNPTTDAGTSAYPAARLHRGDGASSLSPALRAVLRCPMTRSKLVAVDEHHMMSERPFREGVHPVFQVVDGIPNFLPLAR